MLFLFYLFKSSNLFNSASISIEFAQHKANFILKQLEQHLSTREWLELGHPTIAELAVFPYLALASDAKISLDDYPSIRAWMKLFEELPGFISMAGVSKKK